MRLIVLTSIISMILAACSSAPDPTDLPFYTSTPRVMQPAPRPTQSTDDTEPLLSFQAGNPQTITTSGAFQVTVSGAVETESSTGNIVYNFVPASGSVAARDKIFITLTDEQSSQQISLEFPPGLDPGTYDIVSSDPTLPVITSAQYLRLSDEGDGNNRIQSYSENVAGSLVLLEVGELITGVFEFTAEWTPRTGNVVEATRTITVSGEFTEVAYFRTENPFDEHNPVPHQASPIPVIGGE